MNRLAVFLCFIFFLFSTNSFANELEFNQALELLLKTNNELQALKQEINKSELENKATQGLYFPNLSLSAGYVKLNEPIEADISKLANAVPIPGLPSTLPLIEDSFFTSRIMATWVIFSGGKITAANNLSKTAVDASKLTEEVTKEQLSSALAQRYFGYIIAIKIENLRFAALESIKRHYENAIKMEKTGTIPKVERMHAEVSLAEAERNYIKSTKDRQIAAIALNNLINTTETPTLTTKIFLISLNKLPDLDYFLQQAYDNSPIIKQYAIQKDAARTIVRMKQSSFYPNLMLFGSKELYSQNYSELSPDWAVGLIANWTLFKGFTNQREVQAARKHELTIDHREVQARRDLNTKVKITYSQLEKSVAHYNSIKSSLDFTREYLRVRTKAFEGGLATSSDVIDAQLALLNAELDASIAAYDYITNFTTLLATCGIMDSFEKYRLTADLTVGDEKNE